MTIDHLGGWLSNYTHESLGYVSALEGFVFLSGFMFASVYLKDATRPRRLFARVARRAWTIYRHQLVLLLLLPLLMWSAAHRAALADWVQPYFTAPATYFGLALVLIHQPVYMDILPMYLLFLLVSPVLLIALQEGWTAAVLLASGSLWLGAQYFRPIVSTVALCAGCRHAPTTPGAWQLVWVAGLYCGYRYRTRRLVVPDANPLVLVTCIAIGGLLFLSRHQWIALGFDVDRAAAIGHLAWLRMLNFGVLTALVVALLRRLSPESGISWLALLGRASLQVFAFHVVLVYVLLPYHEQVVKVGGRTGDLALTLAVVASLTIPALVYRRYAAAHRPPLLPSLEILNPDGAVPERVI